MKKQTDYSIYQLLICCTFPQSTSTPPRFVALGKYDVTARALATTLPITAKLQPHSSRDISVASILPTRAL